MNIFNDDLGVDFTGVTMESKLFSKEEVDQQIIFKKIRRDRYRKQNRVVEGIKIIKGLVEELPEGGDIEIISRSFDSPTIVLAFLDQITELFIATWAITPAGIAVLEEIANEGIIKECIMILDKTHSYKWLFKSDAYKILKGKVRFRFCANHSKFICFKLKDGRCLNFVGSMNFTNNPRLENIRIHDNAADFEFYKNFVKTVKAETL